MRTFMSRCTCLELPIFEEKNKMTPNLPKKSFILRKTFLHKISRICKSLFLHIPLPPTPYSLKHRYLKEGYHPTTVFLPSCDLKTGPHRCQHSTPCDYYCVMALLTDTVGRGELQKSVIQQSSCCLARQGDNSRPQGFH